MSEVCRALHLLLASQQKVVAPFATKNLPLNGIYLVLEKGEYAHGTQRIVRVGSHRGENKLPSRIAEHFHRENKDRSIFRKNIGRALLNKANDPFLANWELDLTSRAARESYRNSVDPSRLANVEKQVTEYMHHQFSVVSFRIDDRAARDVWEFKIIATLHACEECRPSSGWLGQYSPVRKIRESGLWLVNGLEGEPISVQEFADFTRLIASQRNPVGAGNT